MNGLCHWMIVMDVPSSTRWQKRWEEGWAGPIHQHLYTRLSSLVLCRCCILLTLEHVLDENRALDNLLVGGKLLIVGSDEEDHGCAVVTIVNWAKGDWLTCNEDQPCLFIRAMSQDFLGKRRASPWARPLTSLDSKQAVRNPLSAHNVLSDSLLRCGKEPFYIIWSVYCH